MPWYGFAVTRSCINARQLNEGFNETSTCNQQNNISVLSNLGQFPELELLHGNIGESHNLG